MPLLNPNNIHDQDVFILTRRGIDELQSAETTVTREALEILVLTDGRANVSKTMSRLQLGTDVFFSTLQVLIQEGYIDLASNQITDSLDFIDFFRAAPRLPSSRTIELAESEAACGVSTLQKSGYFVRIALRPPVTRESTEAPRILVIEDDLSLARFLGQQLEFEGFTAAIASNRDEIVAQLGSLPLPDLVLLDVVLPDTDGFSVLYKMREHPVLRSVPVLMLTARASRESVLKGLAGGANGYITKPFDPNAFILAVRTVLGLPKNPFDRRFLKIPDQNPR
ncbi:MAG: response regulator [Burkholderiales bacterium]|nr:response regulator [Burkholderiales bacterium]